MLPRLLFLLSLLTFNLPTCNPQTLYSGLDTNLRGLSASRANNSLILWATGSNGVILRSPDAGKSWTRLHIDNADTQDFRGVQSVGADIAYGMDIGDTLQLSALIAPEGVEFALNVQAADLDGDPVALTAITLPADSFTSSRRF